MENKFNQATAQRPEGTRPLDADMIPVDLKKSIAQLRGEKAYSQNGKNAITLFKSRRLTLTLLVMKPAEVLHPASSSDEIVMTLQVLEGSLMFDNQKYSIDLVETQLVTLHQPLNFQATAITEAVCLLTVLH